MKIIEYLLGKHWKTHLNAMLVGCIGVIYNSSILFYMNEDIFRQAEIEFGLKYAALIMLSDQFLPVLLQGFIIMTIVGYLIQEDVWTFVKHKMKI